jgi:hypothetical protein
LPTLCAHPALDEHQERLSVASMLSERNQALDYLRALREAQEKDFVRYVVDWRDLKWSSIKRADVQNRVNHARQNNGPAAANPIIILMKAIPSWNIRSGYIDAESRDQCLRKLDRVDTVKRTFSLLPSLAA